MQFFEKLLRTTGGDPRKAIQEIPEILSLFVVDFPDEATLQRLATLQAIDEAGSARLRFTMAVANLPIATAAMKAAMTLDLTPLLRQRLNEKLKELEIQLKIGDYVRDTTELNALGATLELPPASMLERTREQRIRAGYLFELLSKIRTENYAAAIALDARSPGKKGFPAFSKLVVVHYVGESLIDANATGSMNQLADGLNEMYRPGFLALVKDIKKLL